MILRAVALPGTPLIVPGAAGGATVLASTRAQVLDALGELVRGARRVVVVDCSARRPADRRGTMRPGLEAAGIDPRWWGWGAPDAPDGVPVAGVPASVALLALGEVGWGGPVEVVEPGTGTSPEAVRTLVEEVLGEAGAVLVVVTSTPTPTPDGGARPVRGPDVERALHDLLARHGVPVVARTTGEYEERSYEVVRFVAPADVSAATVQR